MKESSKKAQKNIKENWNELTKETEDLEEESTDKPKAIKTKKSTRKLSKM